MAEQHDGSETPRKSLMPRNWNFPVMIGPKTGKQVAKGNQHHEDSSAAWPRCPTKYVRPYSKGEKNDYRDAEAIAEAVQRPTMKFVGTKSVDQLDLQALHRVRERLVGQRTGIINQIRGFRPTPPRIGLACSPQS
jgi:transposase